MEDSQFSQQRYFVVCPLKQELDEDAETDSLSGRSSGGRLRRCARPPDGHQLALCTDLHRSHFTRPVFGGRSALLSLETRTTQPQKISFTLSNATGWENTPSPHGKITRNLLLN